MCLKNKHVLYECFELRSPVTPVLTTCFRRSHLRIDDFYLFKHWKRLGRISHPSGPYLEAPSLGRGSFNAGAFPGKWEAKPKIALHE